MKYAKPLVLCFEGIDGCGKTTVINAFKEYLDSEGIPSIIRKYVADGYLREAILHDETLTPVMRATLLRFLASNVAKEVNELLCQGYFVLMDRGPMSYNVYQAHVEKLSLELRRIEKIAEPGLVPDYTFLLDLDHDTAVERLKNRGEPLDVIETMLVNSRAKMIRDAYLFEQSQDMEHCIIVDADQPPKLLLSEIVDHFNTLIENELTNELPA